MSENLVYLKSYHAPEVDKCEVLRYAGVRGESPEMAELLDSCIDEVRGKISLKVCYREYDVRMLDGEVDLGFCTTSSASMIKTLEGCQKIVVFCATVGAQMDRIISRYSLVSPARSVMLQALGSERVEALCDMFCSEIRSKIESVGGEITRRFSPGYGDLPLEVQRDIFRSLTPEYKIGVSLGLDLFMTPTKSVTAIIGIKM